MDILNDELTKINLLIKYKDLYYNHANVGGISDEAFDLLEDELRTKYPKSDYFKIVGSVPKGSDIVFDTPMRSMGKINNQSLIKSWLSAMTHPIELITIQYKYDGISCRNFYTYSVSSARYELTKQSTRGNGAIGKSIDIHIATIPEYIYANHEFYGDVIKVDGELLVHKSSKPIFTKDDKPVSLRNIASGIIMSKEPHKHQALLNFKPFKIHLKDDIKFNNADEEYDLIESFDFEPDRPIVFKTDSDEYDDYITEYLKTGRDALDFETDGLIITVADYNLHESINITKIVNHHNHYNIAFKPPAAKGITTFLKVEFSVSAFGRITPIAVVKPIVIESVVYERSTLDNMKHYVESKLGKGSTVVIERRNDVIPKLTEIIELSGSPFKGLTVCPECSKPVDWIGVHQVCSNTKCPGVLKGRLNNFIKRLNIKEVGESTIEKLYTYCGIKNLVDLTKQINLNDLLTVEGFGEKKIKTIRENLDNITHVEYRFEEILAACSVPNVQAKSLKKLKLFNMEDVNNWKSELKRRRSRNEKIFAIEESLDMFLDDKTKKDEFVELLGLIRINQQQIQFTSKACITGSVGKLTRKDVEQYLSTIGVELISSVTKDCDVLIVGADEDGSYDMTSKVIKANKLNIPLCIISDGDLTKTLNYIK